MQEEGTVAIAHSPTRETARNFARALITCISHTARQPARPGDFRGNDPTLHDSERRNNTKTCYRAPFRVYATNKKGDDASTTPRSTTVMTKAIRCHMMNSRQGLAHHTYPHRYSASSGTTRFVLRMSHTIKNKQKLILRSKRIRGQFEALERVLDEGRDCSEVLQIISAARGAVNSLMTELLEGHIRHHVLDPKRKPNPEQTHAADEVIDMVKTYLR